MRWETSSKIFFCACACCVFARFACPEDGHTRPFLTARIVEKSPASSTPVAPRFEKFAEEKGRATGVRFSEGFPLLGPRMGLPKYIQIESLLRGEGRIWGSPVVTMPKFQKLSCSLVQLRCAHTLPSGTGTAGREYGGRRRQHARVDRSVYFLQRR